MSIGGSGCDDTPTRGGGGDENEGGAGGGGGGAAAEEVAVGAGGGGGGAGGACMMTKATSFGGRHKSRKREAKNGSEKWKKVYGSGGCEWSGRKLKEFLKTRR